MGAAMAGTRSRQLRAADGDLAAVRTVRRLRMILVHSLRSELDARPLLDNWAALVRYLRADMGHATVERLRILYLNGANGLLSDEVVATGTLDATPFYIREIVARAIQIGAAALVLAHNHPSGSTKPSISDVERTRALVDVCRGLGIEVHDHLIIAGHKVASLRAMGVMGT